MAGVCAGGMAATHPDMVQRLMAIGIPHLAALMITAGCIA